MLKFEEIFEMKKNLAFGEKNYNYYGAYLKQKFNGQKVYKVIVDAGFTVPIVTVRRDMAAVPTVMWSPSRLYQRIWKTSESS